MICIDIICSNGRVFMVQSNPAKSRVAEFKGYLLEYITGIPATYQKLIYNGTTLEDGRTLASYGIQEYHAIHMEIAHYPRFADTETTPPSDITTGGLGLPGLDRPTRGTPDMNQLIPAISLMMQSVLSNPQYMKQIIDQNPQLHDYIPQLREMMQNPEVVRRLTSPQMMQQMMSSQLLPELNQQSPLGILQPRATAEPLEQLYATQLSQLKKWYQGSTC